MATGKGGWGLLARFEARAVLGFRDKTPTPQEGKWGNGKLALSLIKVGREEGKGRSELRCCLAPISSPVVCAGSPKSQPGRKDLDVPLRSCVSLGKSLPPLGLRDFFPSSLLFLFFKQVQHRTAEDMGRGPLSSLPS